MSIYARLLRFAIFLALIFLAWLGDWSGIILFFAGFTLYEALSHWCVLYAAIGRDTCGL